MTVKALLQSCCCYSLSNGGSGFYGLYATLTVARTGCWLAVPIEGN